MPGSVTSQGLAAYAAAAAAVVGYWAWQKQKGFTGSAVAPSRNVANADIPRPGAGDMFDRATVDTFPPGHHDGSTDAAPKSYPVGARPPAAGGGGAGTRTPTL